MSLPDGFSGLSIDLVEARPGGRAAITQSFWHDTSGRPVPRDPASRL